MDKSVEKIEIIRSQRDTLSTAYHELQVDYTIVTSLLKQANERLELAKVRIAELESSSGGVKVAGEADADAAA